VILSTVRRKKKFEREEKTGHTLDLEGRGGPHFSISFPFGGGRAGLLGDAEENGKRKKGGRKKGGRDATFPPAPQRGAGGGG